jgi:hypothetical protein
MQTTAAFLRARVKKPNEDDCGKFKRVLQYLNKTKYLKLHINVDELGILK